MQSESIVEQSEADQTTRGPLPYESRPPSPQGICKLGTTFRQKLLLGHCKQVSFKCRAPSSIKSKEQLGLLSIAR